jgi:hypothetical protein
VLSVPSMRTIRSEPESAHRSIRARDIRGVYSVYRLHQQEKNYHNKQCSHTFAVKETTFCGLSMLSRRLCKACMNTVIKLPNSQKSISP